MTKTKDQRGFGIVEAIIVILIIAVLGFAGWYVCHKNHKKDDTNKSSNQTSQNDTKKPDEQKTADPTEGGKYLVISGWGVRVPLPQELQGDILVNVNSDGNGDSSGITGFASKQLNMLTGDDSCNFIKQPDGTFAGGIQARLTRVNPKTYPAASIAYFKGLGTYQATVGDYEYYSRVSTKTPPITCLTGVHEDLNAREQAITDKLVATFKQIESVKQ